MCGVISGCISLGLHGWDPVPTCGGAAFPPNIIKECWGASAASPITQLNSDPIFAEVTQAIKNLPAMQGLIPGLGRSPAERNGNPIQILAWEIPWTEDLVSYSPTGCKE